VNLFEITNQTTTNPSRWKTLHVRSRAGVHHPTATRAIKIIVNNKPFTEAMV